MKLTHAEKAQLLGILALEFLCGASHMAHAGDLPEARFLVAYALVAAAFALRQWFRHRQTLETDRKDTHQ